MKTQTKIYTILTLFAIFLTFLVYLYNGEMQYKEETKNYKLFLNTSSKLVHLQRKWSNKTEDIKLIKQIKSRFKPSFYEKKKNIHIMNFKNLTKNSLNRLGKMLLNSNLTIKVIHLKKENKKISLYVEVQI